MQESHSKSLIKAEQFNFRHEGPSLSITSERTFYSLWFTQTRPKPEVSSVKLHIYTKEVIRKVDLITVEVIYKIQVKTLPLLVVAGKGSSLIRRNWLTELNLDWHELYQMYPHVQCLFTTLSREKFFTKLELAQP